MFEQLANFKIYKTEEGMNQMKIGLGLAVTRNSKWLTQS
jgi:hypothetical protein